MVTKPGPLAHLGQTQAQLLTQLLLNKQGMDADSLVDKLGITKNAVRQHLSNLERDGLVERRHFMPSGGRPKLIFGLTTFGQECFPRGYAEISQALIESIVEVYGQEGLSNLMKQMGQKTAKALNINSELSAEEISTTMASLGYHTERPTKPNEIVAHNCIFHQIAEQHSQVCEFDLAFLESLSGKKVQHTECMVRQGKVCRFQFEV